MDDYSTFDDDPMLDPDEEQKGLGLTWTVIIAVAVVGAIAFGISIFLRDRQPPVSNTSVQSEQPAASIEIPPAETASAEALFEQGNVYVQNGQLTEAIAAYEQALALDPEYQAVYANLGVVYYQLDQLDNAAAQYEKALELDPNDGEVTYNLAALNLQRALTAGSEPDPELLNQTISLLNKALELSPDLAEPYFTLGVAYISLEQPDEAKRAFETFLEKDSGTDPRASQEAQRYLDTLIAE